MLWAAAPQNDRSGGVGDELDNLGCVGADGHGASMAGDDGDVKDLFDRAINAEPFGACPFGQINDLDPAPWFAVGATLTGQIPVRGLARKWCTQLDSNQWPPD